MAGPTRSPAGEAVRDASAPVPPRPDGRAGYVLIEAVAALAITLLILRLTLPLFGSGTTPPKLLALVSSSVSLLRDARTAAIIGRPTVARFDVARRTLSAAGHAVAIPADVAFSLVAGGNCPADAAGSGVLFRPDGSNCGGILRFATGTRAIRAQVDWADGHVDVVQER